MSPTGHAARLDGEWENKAAVSKHCVTCETPRINVPNPQPGQFHWATTCDSTTIACSDPRLLFAHVLQWDTAGQERFRTITSSYYRGAHGIIIVYDVTDPESYEAVDRWLMEIEKFAGADVSRMLVGNKCDLEAKRKISKDDAAAFATEKGLPFYETSAKENRNVEEAFLDLTSKIKQRPRAPLHRAAVPLVSVTYDLGIIVGRNLQTAMDPKKTNLVDMKNQTPGRTQKDACAC